MDRIIEKLDRGWWVVSHEQKLWLPGGELPHGEAVNFDLVGQHALHIGEWQGESVWMVRGIVAMTWDRCAVLDQDPGLFQLAGRGSSSPNFIARINFAVTAATRCMPAKANGRCCAATAVNVTTRKLPLHYRGNPSRRCDPAGATYAPSQRRAHRAGRLCRGRRNP